MRITVKVLRQLIKEEVSRVYENSAQNHMLGAGPTREFIERLFGELGNNTTALYTQYLQRYVGQRIPLGLDRETGEIVDIECKAIAGGLKNQITIHAIDSNGEIQTFSSLWSL